MVAVMVTGTEGVRACTVARPLPSIETIAGSLERQLAVLPGIGLNAASSASAAYWMVAPTCGYDQQHGVTLTHATAPPVTRISADVVLPSTEKLMRVIPDPTPFAIPT